MPQTLMTPHINSKVGFGYHTAYGYSLILHVHVIHWRNQPNHKLDFLSQQLFLSLAHYHSSSTKLSSEPGEPGHTYSPTYSGNQSGHWAQKFKPARISQQDPISKQHLTQEKVSNKSLSSKTAGLWRRPSWKSVCSEVYVMLDDTGVAALS